LYAISKSGTGSKTTEVHILNGANNFQSFLLHTGTALHETGDTFDFALGDYNGNGILDLYAISKSGTGSKTTEVHVLNGADNFQSFLLHTGTALHETGNTFQFLLGDYNRNGKLDLYAISKSGTGSKTTEVHVLNGANNFQSFLLHTGTVLHETGDNFQFLLGDYNRNGKPDLYAISKSGTGSKTTEVHVLQIKGTSAPPAAPPAAHPAANPPPCGHSIIDNTSQVAIIPQGNGTRKATAHTSGVDPGSKNFWSAAVRVTVAFALFSAVLAFIFSKWHSN